jgi:diphosphomevalonate decarboxylase
MKATAVAPANIAFIKYWGRKDPQLRIPYNPSISMNLSNCTTTTTVEFSKDFSEDRVSEGFDDRRILEHLDRLRKLAGIKARVHVETKNNFPISTGIASSASGFAALTVAGTSALGMKLSEKELTALARLGSGSACRSIPDGFVKWEGEFAYSLYPADYWGIRDILVIVDEGAKKISSSEGHDKAITSPYFNKRLQELPKRINRLEAALQDKNFRMFGEVIEEDCLDMHHVMQTQAPPLFYWNDKTKQVIDMLKESKLPAYFTVDAGPNVHVVCEENDEQKVAELFNEWKIIINKPAAGAHVI